jgi:hypothetical protein
VEGTGRKRGLRKKKSGRRESEESQRRRRERKRKDVLRESRVVLYLT